MVQMGECHSPKTLLFYERGSWEHESVRDVIKKIFDLIMDVDK